MSDRIHDLNNLLKEDPDDPFLYYALGLEYIKEGHQDMALVMFNLIIRKFTDYLPVYYQAARLEMEMGDLEIAEMTFKAGIALAERTSDHKTLLELKDAYNNFLIEREDQ
jgi:tetratricopeptide (TPR) repeat protein